MAGTRTSRLNCLLFEWVTGVDTRCWTVTTLRSSQFCSMLPAFVFEARPVVPVMDAVRVELEAIAFRDGPKVK